MEDEIRARASTTRNVTCSTGRIGEGIAQSAATIEIISSITDWYQTSPSGIRCARGKSSLMWMKFNVLPHRRKTLNSRHSWPSPKSNVHHRSNSISFAMVWTKPFLSSQLSFASFRYRSSLPWITMLILRYLIFYLTRWLFCKWFSSNLFLFGFYSLLSQRQHTYTHDSQCSSRYWPFW